MRASGDEEEEGALPGRVAELALSGSDGGEEGRGPCPSACAPVRASHELSRCILRSVLCSRCLLASIVRMGGLRHRESRHLPEALA